MVLSLALGEGGLESGFVDSVVTTSRSTLVFADAVP